MVTSFGVSHGITFQGCACLNVSHIKVLKELHDTFAYYVRIWLKQDVKYIYFIFFYKFGDWNIFVETNVVYLCTQKHKYIPKINLNDFWSLWKLKVYWPMSFHIVWKMFGYYAINLRFFISKKKKNLAKMW
jgi:hypothetical protein